MERMYTTRLKHEFYKENRGDKVWHVDFIKQCGMHAVSFDKKRILFLFGDYPLKFTPEQKELFDKENPYWANFFKDRNTEFELVKKFSIFDDKSTFESCLDSAKDNYSQYCPENYLYRKIASYKFIDKFSDEFLELLYVTLSVEFENQKLGKLKDFSIFAESIKKHQENFKELSPLKLRDLDEWDWEECREIFEDLFSDLELVNGKSSVIAFSKVLHFMLPNLIVSIDRKNTMRFFYGKKYSCFKSLENQYQTFWNLETVFSEFVKRNKVSQYIDDTCNLNIPKILDNAIIGKLLQDS
jgi:hypothetical protein